jgi:hypothetical protein
VGSICRLGFLVLKIAVLNCHWAAFANAMFLLNNCKISLEGGRERERERFIAIWSAWWLGNSATWEGMGAVKGFEDFPSVLFQGLVGGSASRFCWSFPLWTLQNSDKWKEEGIGKSFEHLG